MRQAGIIAAAGLYALENHRDRLVEDHLKAKKLAEGLNQTSWFRVDPDDIETNIVFFHVRDNAAARAVALLKENGILVSATKPDTIRAVMHLDISNEQLNKTLDVLAHQFDSFVAA